MQGKKLHQEPVVMERQNNACVPMVSLQLKFYCLVRACIARILWPVCLTYGPDLGEYRVLGSFGSKPRPQRSTSHSRMVPVVASMVKSYSVWPLRSSPS